MKNKFFKTMFALVSFGLLSNAVFADVVTPIIPTTSGMNETVLHIVLALIGIIVVVAIAALIVAGVKKDDNVKSQANVEPVFGAVPKAEEKMEGEENEKNNE